MSNIQIINGTWQDELPKLADNSVDLIICDPPYLVTKEKWDKVEQVNEELSKQLFRIAKDSCSLYVWCGIGEKSQSLIQWFPVFSNEWHFKDLITWKKQRGIGMRKGWLYTREEIMWFVKNNKCFTWNIENQYSETKRSETGFTKSDIERTGRDVLRHSNVWVDITEVSLGDSGVKRYSNQNTTKLHYTPKPEKAIDRIIKAHCKEGDTVLDCFLDSGTTAIVCKKLNMNCVGIEKEEEYCKLAQERVDPILLTMNDIELWLGNCLDLMPQIPDKSVDSIICDLPFSITKNKWDIIIPFEPLWLQYKRIIKDNCAILLHADGIFTGLCMLSNPDWYKYDIIWNKISTTGFLNSKIMPLRQHEHVLVFGKNKIKYNPQMVERGKPRKKGGYQAGNKGCYNNTNDLITINNLYYPTSIISFSNADQKNKLHPTQKPLSLLKYLVKMYTNEEDLVLDNCMGSGTTGLACKNLNRRFIGIEKEQKYYDIVKERLGL